VLVDILVVAAGFSGFALGGALALIFRLTASRRLRVVELDVADLNTRVLRGIRQRAADARWAQNGDIGDVPGSFPAAKPGLMPPADFIAKKWAGLAKPKGPANG